MEIYTTRRGTRIAVGDAFRDVGRADARTLRVVALGEPYLDWRGIRRCEVTYRIVAQVGATKVPQGTKTVDAERLADRAVYVRVENAGGEA
ncbi:hypothetical protein [Nocardia wallacei]|uniref:hypothetical protein n=1 Tax=Nocardia wallacei TaxID=480035 RepID=UPI0024564C17|nr:hypothetical protein [Nocardia wallacei]